MFYDGPPGMMLDLVGLSPNGVDLEWSHPYSNAQPYRNVSRRQPAHAYAYAGNNPTRYIDPSGLYYWENERGDYCGPYVYLYTGSWCVKPNVWNDAMDAAAGVVNCWWKCEVETHKPVCGKLLVATEVITGSISVVGARIPKPPDMMRFPGDDYRSLFRELAKRFGNKRAEEIIRALVRNRPIMGAANGGAATAALVELGIAINCSIQCR